MSWSGKVSRRLRTPLPGGGHRPPPSCSAKIPSSPTLTSRQVPRLGYRTWGKVSPVDGFHPNRRIGRSRQPEPFPGFLNQGNTHATPDDPALPLFSTTGFKLGRWSHFFCRLGDDFAFFYYSFFSLVPWPRWRTPILQLQHHSFAAQQENPGPCWPFLFPFSNLTDKRKRGAFADCQIDPED